jgi:hypothetical protein
MTISSETRKAGPFVGNDSSTSFPFTFKVFKADDLLVVRADEDGVETVLVLGTNYTVSLNANQNANPGGTVVLGTALATGTTLVLTSAVENLQPTDLTNQGGFYPKVISDALDRATIQIQQLQEQVDRSAKLPITNAADADSLVADIVLLADNNANINTVAGSIAGVQTVADDIADVSTVADDIANVNATGGSIASVNTVATNIASVNSAATNMAAIIAAPTQASNAAESASAAATSETNAAAAAAAAAASLDNFDDRYLGPKTSNPTVDNDGNALVTGALYYRSTAPVGMKVYDGAQWIEASSAQQAALVTFEYEATAGQTTFTGNDANGVTLSYITGGVVVALNGLVLRPGDDYTATNGTSIVLLVGAAAGDELMVFAFSSFVVANTYTQAQVDAALALKLNASAGAVGTTNLANLAVTPEKIAQKLTLATAVTASGTAIDFTGIPSWVKRITVMFNGVSTNGTSIPMLQIGDAGGIETTGYLGASSICSGGGTTSNNFTTGFGAGGILAANLLHGSFALSLVDSANTWAISGVVGGSSSAFTVLTGGTKTLSATLDRIRIATVNGTDTFDAGTINIMFEG